MSAGRSSASAGGVGCRGGYSSRGAVLLGLLIVIVQFLVLVMLVGMLYLQRLAVVPCI